MLVRVTLVGTVRPAETVTVVIVDQRHNINRFGPVAPMVEQLPCTERVVGSNPTWSTEEIVSSNLTTSTTRAYSLIGKAPHLPCCSNQMARCEIATLVYAGSNPVCSSITKQENLMKMLGHKGKPFCGDCCCKYPQGSGKVNKRILKKIQKSN